MIFRPRQPTFVDRDDVKSAGEAFDLGDVLLDELEAIKGRRALMSDEVAPAASLEALSSRTEGVSEKLAGYYSSVHALGDLSGIAISGGGIRSAAFSLGVLQGLASRGVLSKFDYLSTVSGGGYIGAFLTSWVQREGYEAVAAALAGDAQVQPDGFAPLQHLRRYSAYLTPRTGLVSSDTLTVVVLYIRNLILNWLVLLPVLLGVIIGIKLLAVISWGPTLTPEAFGFLGILVITFLGLAVLDSLRQRPGWEADVGGHDQFRGWELGPGFIAGILVGVAAIQLGKLQSSVSEIKITDAFVQCAGIGAVAWATAWIIAFLMSKPEDKAKASTKETVRSSSAIQATWGFSSFACSGAITLVTLALMFRGTAVIGGWWAAGEVARAADVRAVLFFCLGPSLLAVSLCIGELVYVGATSYTAWSDGEREWLARASAFHLRLAIGWSLLVAIVIGGSAAIVTLYESFPRSQGTVSASMLSLGGFAGALTALLGKASTTAASFEKLEASWKSRLSGAALAVTSVTFVVVVTSLASVAIDSLVAHPCWDRLGAILTGLMLAVLAVGTASSIAINTNRFSLHALYRNRLIRTFLGASNRTRRANSFTDFDENDNLVMADLWPNRTPGGSQPPQLLLVNCALNITATDELAWRERKALSFVASARAVGCGALHGYGAFRRSDQYASGVTLGTMMTISGAAASPNMGYHSSSALSVLLTMFNVRLGAWLGNPGPQGHKTFRYPGPLFAATPLVQEALGRTSDDKPYVYLSDGGHFENLGVYELFRRRCRYIVVIDAGCDPSCSFEDLGNAVRKSWIDLRVRVTFRELSISPRSFPPKAHSYIAIGRVTYPEPGAPEGMILYIKPGYQGTEPLSVRSYAASNATFPHESTAKQSFGESQFEAYRALGEHEVSALESDGVVRYRDIRTFFEAVSCLGKSQEGEHHEA